MFDCSIVGSINLSVFAAQNIAREPEKSMRHVTTCDCDATAAKNAAQATKMKDQKIYLLYTRSFALCPLVLTTVVVLR